MNANLIAGLISTTAIEQLALDLLTPNSNVELFLKEKRRIKNRIFSSCKDPPHFSFGSAPEFFQAVGKDAILRTSDGREYARNDPKNGIEFFTEVKVQPEWIERFYEAKSSGKTFVFGKKNLKFRPAPRRGKRSRSRSSRRSGPELFGRRKVRAPDGSS